MKHNISVLSTVAMMILALAIQSWSAESGGNVDWSRGLGVSFGGVSGTGFSVRSIPEHGLGYHAALLYYKDEDISATWFAINALYSLNRGHSSTFYLLTGFSNFSTREKQHDGHWDWNSQQYHERNYTKKHSDWFWGIGCGFGWRIIGDFWSSFELVMTGYEGTFLPIPQVQFYYLLW